MGFRLDSPAHNRKPVITGAYVKGLFHHEKEVYK